MVDSSLTKTLSLDDILNHQNSFTDDSPFKLRRTLLSKEKAFDIPSTEPPAYPLATIKTDELATLHDYHVRSDPILVNVAKIYSDPPETIPFHIDSHNLLSL